MADENETEESEVDEIGSDEEEGKGSKKFLIIGIILGILVIGGGAGAFLALSGGDDSSGKEPTEVSTDPAAEDTANTTPEEKATEGEAAADGDAKSDEEKKSEGAEKEKVAIDFGDTFQMKTFSLNLGNALENRFVRLEVTLEYSGGEDHKAEIEKRLPQLRDAVISVVSRKTREFLLAPDGKDTLRKEVLIRINRYMKTKIDAVYITDILIE